MQEMLGESVVMLPQLYCTVIMSDRPYLNGLNEKTHFIKLIGIMLISFGLTLMVSSNGCDFPIIYMGVRYLIVEYNSVFFICPICVYGLRNPMFY